MSDNTSAPDCWEAAADENLSTIATSMSTLNVNAPVFIPNVNAPEFVPSFMKEETGQTQPAAPGAGSQGVAREVGQAIVAESSTSWWGTWGRACREYNGLPVTGDLGGYIWLHEARLSALRNAGNLDRLAVSLRLM
ncbi:Eukaryotic peptide chain release factor GTP-binding subunit ERF3B [Portunus trituberculatus]|uniref:Eukaryotic peptide chain release factor GTP-binding subunit ERF3B n=1 Tax=Portunus trituberculatus TaxID=210409 RepID=A0A5B7D632_PORTR|nr:Eukaryotic peptide chain release factor GTP-binding subunit ERF3B [Portunus trituberculatus]